MFPAASPAVVAGLGITHGLPLSDEEADVWPTQANEGVAGHVETTNKEVSMLVLSRKANQEICIGDNIRVMVIELRGDKVRLGVAAPRDVPVHRHEVHDAIKREQDATDSDCD